MAASSPPATASQDRLGMFMIRPREGWNILILHLGVKLAWPDAKARQKNKAQLLGATVAFVPR
jgi:hypothetical protein